MAITKNIKSKLMSKKYLILAIVFLGSLTSYSQTHDSFSPEKGKKYVLSCWVKEMHASQVTSYTSTIEIYLSGNANDLNAPAFHSIAPSGHIIDGWQRIIGVFTISEDTSLNHLGFRFVNANSNDTYFDDLRVFAHGGTLKGFVYDEKTQRLMAELDENNYATFYEYDSEGGLVRVKKETEKGIYTIQETRSGNVKDN